MNMWFSYCKRFYYILTLIAALTSMSFSLHANGFMDKLSLISTTTPFCPKPVIQLNDIRKMLYTEAPTLRSEVINHTISVLDCSSKYRVNHNNILTIIDYSLPANEKRLWIFDLDTKKLLFNTYVSHGIKSGALFSTKFSNKYDSKSSSLGVFTTEKAYFGRHGLSLQLAGLESGFNNNASNRSIVIHGGWYVEEDFIKKYGRAGRSWGCPAVPDNLVQPIINTIKDQSLLVLYYPNDDWLSKSRFLKCDKFALTQNPALKPLVDDSEQRDPVLITDLRQHSKSEESTAVVVVSADNYQRIFHTNVPLARMLRRQIDNVEYIALSTTEFENVIANNELNNIYFVNPVIKMVRGYYVTEMHIADLGKVKSAAKNDKNYTVVFEAKGAISLRSADQFIRWLGL